VAKYMRRASPPPSPTGFGMTVAIPSPSTSPISPPRSGHPSRSSRPSRTSRRPRCCFVIETRCTTKSSPGESSVWGSARVLAAPRAPRLNPFVERVISSIRPEGLDHCHFLHPERGPSRAALTPLPRLRQHRAATPIARPQPSPATSRGAPPRPPRRDSAGRRAPSALSAGRLIVVGISLRLFA
jgi:hypothetical protein